jgi:hypothetical protein
MTHKGIKTMSLPSGAAVMALVTEKKQVLSPRLAITDMLGDFAKPCTVLF